MDDRRLAVHRTIVVVDVEGFGDQRRTNRHQLAVREGLYGVVREAFYRAEIPWDACDHEDRGDGVFILAPAEVPKGLFVELLPSALVAALRVHNDTHVGQERIRLRLALHAGEVHYDEHGVTAASINLAFRLLYEFLHATFGEFLVARLVAQVLTDVLKRERTAGRSSLAGADDGLLHALLSFAESVNLNEAPSRGIY